MPEQEKPATTSQDSESESWMENRSKYSSEVMAEYYAALDILTHWRDAMLAELWWSTEIALEDFDLALDRMTHMKNQMWPK